MRAAGSARLLSPPSWRLFWQRRPPFGQALAGRQRTWGTSAPRILPGRPERLRQSRLSPGDCLTLTSIDRNSGYDLRMRSSRLLSVLLLLQARGRMTARELATEL